MNIEEIGKILLKWVSSQIMRTNRVTLRMFEKKCIPKSVPKNSSNPDLPLYAPLFYPDPTRLPWRLTFDIPKDQGWVNKMLYVILENYQAMVWIEPRCAPVFGKDQALR